MSRTIKGTVRKQNHTILVSIQNKDRPKLINASSFKIVNSVGSVLGDGDEVVGYLMLLSKRDNTYGFFVKKHKEPKIDVNNFIHFINLAVIDRVNMEHELFGRLVNTLDVEDINSTRKRPITFCRHIGMYYAVQYLGDQISYEYIANIYNRDRCSIYHAIDEAIPNARDTNPQVKSIMDDLDIEIQTIYNNVIKN
ncbi:MAG: hypothetical protein KAS32_22465 [Candidatus Peribacteraceae bacterium]|nr:hypothetical protein [Candidatus Peribacteraceae bacterium]